MTALWWAVIVAGFYHGLNPGMGWPLAVSGAMMTDRVSALVSALGLLFAGHFLAMSLVLVPFSFSEVLVSQQRNIRIGASLLVIAAGVFLLAYDRHPRFLSRISPAKIGLWSFMAAMAHGAGLMVVPMLLGMSNGQGMTHDGQGMTNGTAGMAHGMEAMTNGTAGMTHGMEGMTHGMTNGTSLADQASLALGVATVHSVAMFTAAALMATLVYFWLGIGFVSKAWFNLDRVWAVSLVVVGIFGLYSAW